MSLSFVSLNTPEPLLLSQTPKSAQVAVHGSGATYMRMACHTLVIDVIFQWCQWYELIFHSFLSTFTQVIRRASMLS